MQQDIVSKIKTHTHELEIHDKRIDMMLPTKEDEGKFLQAAADGSVIWVTFTSAEEEEF